MGFENVKRPVAVEKTKVRATCKVECPKNFMLNQDLLKVSESFLLVPNIEVKIPEEPKKKESSNQSEQPEPVEEPVEQPKPPATWTCGACTYINPSSNRDCEMC